MVRFNNIHPKAAYLNIEHTNFSSYFKDVKARYPSFDYIIWLDESDSYDEYRALGFVEFRRTYDIEIDASEFQLYLTTHWSLLEVVEEEALKLNDALVYQWFLVYQKTHKVNPVMEYNYKLFKDILEKELDISHSIIISTKGEITAYVLVYFYESDVREIGYVYYKDETLKLELFSLLSKRLESLQNIGVTKIISEVDNTDIFAHELFSYFITENSSFQRSLILKNNHKN